MAPAHRMQSPPAEGVAVVGEAVRRIAPESADFLMEVTASGQTASQAMANQQTRTTQIAHAISSLGVQRGDLQTVSLGVTSAYTPVLQMPYAMPQIVQGGGLGGYSPPAAMQPDVQFGSYQARSVIRVVVREASRAGEIADAATRAGATLAGALSWHAADEAGARRSVLEAAGKDARTKAEALAAAAGKQLGEPLAISEEILASNGVYSAMRTQAPWAFGPDTPAAAGELEYYARVTASFRFQ